MTSMIERVAQAIYDLQSDGTGPVSDFYCVALAAIEAMREPTDDMDNHAANKVYVFAGDELHDDYRKDIFRAMIDAALVDPEKYGE